MPLDDRLRAELRQDVEHVKPDTERHLRAALQRSSPGAGTIGWLAAAATSIALIGILVIGLRPAGVLVGPGSSSPGSIDPVPTPMGSVASLEGRTWSVELFDADPGVPWPDMAGRWTMRLDPDSIVELSPPDGFRGHPGVTAIAGVYVISGDGFVTNLFTRDFGAACAGAGDYRFSVVGARLTFSGRDTCLVRRALLTTRPWTAEP